MRTLQQNLLVVVALALCALCVYQWYAQTLQRNELQKLEQMVSEKSAAIQGYTNSIAGLDRQVALMDARLTAIKAEAKTNADLVLLQKRELHGLQATAAGLTNEITGYKAAIESLETRLKTAYEGIQKQNEAVKDLVAQRDELVKKFNDSVKDRNEVVNRYNDLVKRAGVQRAAIAVKPAPGQS